MAVVRITKEFRFEGAHALGGYDGKCRHIHGHSYILYVTVCGEPSVRENDPKLGMLIDFTDLKRIVNEKIINVFDHAMVIREGMPLAEELARQYGNVVSLPFQPTCENLVACFAERIEGELPVGVRLFSLKLHETATSYVEWYALDNR